jgi:hypothetical protein
MRLTRDGRLTLLNPPCSECGEEMSDEEMEE